MKKKKKKITCSAGNHILSWLQNAETCVLLSPELAVLSVLIKMVLCDATDKLMTGKGRLVCSCYQPGAMSRRLVTNGEWQI